MLNVHPIISSFPLALIILIVILELCSRISLIKTTIPNQVIELILFITVICIGAVFLSGYQGLDFINPACPVPEEVISRHHNFGKLLLFVSLACVVFKFFASRALRAKQVFQSFYFFTLLLILIICAYASFLGGQLVFEHGAGVVCGK